MRLSLVLSVLPLAISVGALRVTEPAKDDGIDVTGSLTVKWSSVNTDPSTVDIFLVNNFIYPNFEQKIASDIDTSKGSFTATDLKGVAHGLGFQINLMSTSAQNTGILAQSQQFDVIEPAKSSSEASTTGISTLVSSTVSSTSSTGTSVTSSTSTGASTAETKVITTGTLTPTISTTKISTGFSTSGLHTFEVSTNSRNSTDIPITQATGTTTTTETTASITKSSNHSGLTTSASSATESTHSSTSASTSASPIHSNGAGIALTASGVSGVAAGLLAGALALNL
ncbi:Cell wall beta-glucan synthesis [Penicillium paradoxum]|uniref:Cell wall beta-glucan synthesis n=1 Tax=Penicillium paradoxum TaxID=176176 RepID=UPI002546D0B8|nr:Cell wall beta-glucan synthesis [Penicillium paradoxum]KAJ5794271.1 Cell wall beta-glucan synthesis [Penicillium paradoxum]